MFWSNFRLTLIQLVHSSNLCEQCGRAESADAAADDDGVEAAGGQLLRREGLRSAHAQFAVIQLPEIVHHSGKH